MYPTIMAYTGDSPRRRNLFQSSDIRVTISLVEGSTSFSGRREPWERDWLKDMKG